MSTSSSASNIAASSQSSSDMATILRLENLEKSLARQIRNAEKTASKNPLDQQGKQLVAQLTAELSAVQSDIAVLTGAEALNSGNSSSGVMQMQAREIEQQNQSQSAKAASPDSAAAIDKSHERQKKPFRFDLTGTYVDDEA